MWLGFRLSAEFVGGTRYAYQEMTLTAQMPNHSPRLAT